MRLAPLALVALASCGPSQAEYDRLEAENRTLKGRLTAAETRVQQLEATPANRLTSARRYLAAGDTGNALSSLRALVREDAGAPEAAQAGELLAQVQRAQAEARAAAERRASLGFRVLEPRTTATFADGSLKVNGISRGNRWIHDRRSTGYSNEWQYHDAPRGSDFVMADVSISSESHTPALPPIFVYRLENGALQQVATMDYAFYRWRDYGSFLGNYVDYGNEFTHTRTIRFSAGVEVQEEMLDGAPIFVLVGKQGCFNRTSEALRIPRVQYVEGTCAIEASLSVEQAEAGYTVLRILNAELMPK